MLIFVHKSAFPTLKKKVLQSFFFKKVHTEAQIPCYIIFYIKIVSVFYI